MINFAGFEVRERLHHGRGGRAWHSLLHSCKDEAEEGGGCGLKEGWWDVFFFCRFSFGSLWMDLLKVGIYMGLWFAVIYIYIYIYICICIERVLLKYCWAWDRAGDKDTYDFAGYIGGVELQTVEEGAPLGEGNWSDHAQIFPSLHGLKNWFLANATVCQFSIIAIRNDHL